MAGIYICHYHAPCGELLLGAFEGRLCLCDWATEKHRASVDRHLRKELCAEIRPADLHPWPDFRNRADSGISFLQTDEEYLSGTRHTGSFYESDDESRRVLAAAIKELDEYFAGARTEFDIPLLFVGTDFQKLVWNALVQIPYGTTLSYGELAARIGRPSAVRAVANANAANAVSIFAPCHRVIGSDGSLTGYGGGLDVKKWLLDLESPGLFDAA